MKKVRIALVNVIIAVSFVAVAALSYLAYKHNASESAKSIQVYNTNLRKISRLVASSAELNFLTADQALKNATEKQKLQALFENGDRSDVEKNLSAWVNNTPHIDALLFTDENGVVQAMFRKGENGLDVNPGFSFSAKDHFNYHKEHPEQKLLISTLKKNEQTTNKRIFISRRFEKPGGEFGGLAVAVMDSDYLLNLLASIDAGVGTEIYLLLNDDDFLAGNVPNGDSKLALIKAMMGEANFKKAKEGEITIAERDINDSLNMFSFQTIQGLPITVSIIAKEKDIFAAWRAERARFIGVIFVFILFSSLIISLAVMLVRKMLQAEESEKKARAASQAKSDFLAKMSHELRTPLNAIIGFSEMLSSGYFGKINNAQQIERLTDINLCGTHLLDLISDILEFSKGDAGKLHLNEEDTDMYNISRQTIRMIEQRAQSKEIEIINAISRDAPMLVADSRKLKQILLNLMSNSIKFTNPGGKITLSTHFDSDLNYVITVSDTGVGMDSSQIPKAMEAFEQVHGDVASEGTGLGLPLCKMLTELHGGTFELESKVNIGTKASITLPASRIKVDEEITRRAYKPLVVS